MKILLLRFWTEISNCSRYKVVAGIVCVVILLICYGCPAKCNSILHPGTRLTSRQLQTEIDTFYSLAAAEANDLSKEEELRQYLFDQAITVASTGVFSWYQLATGLGSIIGIGALADNVRYRIKFPKS